MDFLYSICNPLHGRGKARRESSYPMGLHEYGALCPFLVSFYARAKGEARGIFLISIGRDLCPRASPLPEIGFFLVQQIPGGIIVNILAGVFQIRLIPDNVIIIISMPEVRARRMTYLVGVDGRHRLKILDNRRQRTRNGAFEHRIDR